MHMVVRSQHVRVSLRRPTQHSGGAEFEQLVWHVAGRQIFNLIISFATENHCRQTPLDSPAYAHTLMFNRRASIHTCVSRPAIAGSCSQQEYRERQ